MTIAEWTPSDFTLADSRKFATTWSTGGALIHMDEDGGWTVVDPVTGIFGAGHDAAAAQADFEQALADHLDVLERQDTLAPALEEQLAYLHRRLH